MHADYVERELSEALTEGAGSPVEYVQIKAMGPYGSSKWLRLRVPEYKALIAATVAAVSERGE